MSSIGDVSDQVMCLIEGQVLTDARLPQAALDPQSFTSAGVGGLGAIGGNARSCSKRLKVVAYPSRPGGWTSGPQSSSSKCLRSS